MSENELTTSDFTEQNEPFQLFADWLKEAEASEINDPNAVALATVDEDGLPNVRMVLLKGFDQDGFVFYTNFESQKGREVLGQKKAAMCFHWKTLRRQVRLRGPVEVVSRRGSRCLLPDARPRQPHRCLGIQAVATARKPLRAGEGRRRIHRPLCDRRDPAPGALVRFPHPASLDRVLERPEIPAARPHRVPPQ
jgi:uncharacterized pyridoxamine 5'-phosphate oxidase family protein